MGISAGSLITTTLCGSLTREFLDDAFKAIDKDYLDQFYVKDINHDYLDAWAYQFYGLNRLPAEPAIIKDERGNLQTI